MIEPRIYRAAFIPALLAIVLVAFSLEAPPPPLGQGLAADALFDGQEASGLLSEILQTANDRRPGSAGDRAVASEVQTAFTRAGFPTTVDDFSAGGHRLVNVVPLACPIAPGGQGVLLKAGLPAIRISGSGELPPAHERFSDIAQARYGELGRGALRLVSTLDGNSRTPVHGPASYVQVSGQLLPVWGVSVLALTLMLPALLASIDAFARTR